MKLQEILDAKGTTVHSIPEKATLQEVVHRLIELRIGSLVVCRRDAAGQEVPVGIISERDILYASSADGRPLDQVTAAEAMSAALVTVAPDDDVEHVMGLMTSRRVRHLPVLVEGRLAGIISIGDVVKALIDRLAVENRFLKDYIAG